MIGIDLNSINNDIVEEFFELFKTPWEYWRSDGEFDTIITDTVDTAKFSARLIIKLKPDERYEPGEVNPKPLMAMDRQGGSFPIYTGVETVSEGREVLVKTETGRCVGSERDADGRSVITLGYHLFHEIQYIFHEGQDLTLGAYPTVDMHIANLRNWMVLAGLSVVEIPPVAYGSDYFVSLTHDVDFAGIRDHFFDNTMAGFLYRAIFSSSLNLLRRRITTKAWAKNWFHVLVLPLVLLGVVRDFWNQLRKYQEIERDLKSTFFFVPFKGKPGKINREPAPGYRAVKYDVHRLKNEIECLIEEDFEVGVHGIDSWTDLREAGRELVTIQKLANNSDLGIRMHWLYRDQHSMKVLDRAGYSYDSTWGYNEIPGFRAGTYQVFKPAGVERLLEIPLHIMDTALFYPDRLNLAYEDGLNIIRQFVEMARSYGGVITLNWHHRSIAPERLWDDVYKKALEILKAGRGKFMPAGSVVKWFRKRRAIQFKKVAHNNEGAQISLHMNSAQPILKNDRFMLRISQLSKHQDANDSIPANVTVTDHPISEKDEFTIPYGG